MPDPTAAAEFDSGTSRFSPCVVVPVYNHTAAVLPLLARLRLLDLPCILVDDGSGTADHEPLVEAQRRQAAWVEMVRHPENRGKGAAVITGLRVAAQRGFTHAVQIDGDGQHRPEEIPRFLDVARRKPQALIIGRAVFDTSVPTVRKIGRYATHIWVWINTLSRDIRDGMCGLRVYPVVATLAVADAVALGSRMEFDVEVAVRLSWQGVPVISLATPVIYPRGGVSHFRLWHDNLRISAKHAQLFFGMLRRLPVLLPRRWGAR
jgi:glycosyltransferase involved in cell wall biosynthesis